MQNHLSIARRLAVLLDSQFQIGKFKFGIDPILGLLPGGGDALALIISLYIVWVGVQMKLPSMKIAQMLFNVALDAIIGAIPLVGDLFDVSYKANTRNIQILNKYA